MLKFNEAANPGVALFLTWHDPSGGIQDIVKLKLRRLFDKRNVKKEVVRKRS